VAYLQSQSQASSVGQRGDKTVDSGDITISQKSRDHQLGGEIQKSGSEKL